jgi:hypothetical protein
MERKREEITAELMAGFSSTRRARRGREPGKGGRSVR